jgi:hypothetical protein
MKFRTPEVFLGAFLAVAIFAMGMLFGSSGSLPSRDTKIAEHGGKTESLWIPTDSVGLYTLVLAAFTGLLVFVSSAQGYFLLRADKTARIAANAAKLSADAAVGLALPIVGADDPELLDVDGFVPDGDPYAGSDVSGLPKKFSVIPMIAFRNEGQTPAFPTKVVVEWRIGASWFDGEPRFKTYNYASQIIPKNGTWEAEVHFGIEIPDAELAFLKEPGQFLRLRVTVFYDNFLRKERSAIFRWKWNNPGQGVFFFEGDNAPDTQFQQGEETC